MATQDWIKKTTALLVIASQLAIGSMHVAQATTPETPETDFIIGVEALKGNNLSQQQKETQLTELAATYSHDSSDEGRVERFAQALVDLGIATPQRAQEIATKAKDNPKSLEGVSLDGAQFSACPIGITAAAGAIAAASWYASTVYNGDNSMNGFVALMMALPIGGVILAGTCVD